MEDCSICSNRRHIPGPNEGSWIPCKCLQRSWAMDAFNKAGIPEFYWRLRPDHIRGFTPHAKQKKQEIQTYYQSVLEHGFQHRRLLISGPMGTSKTVGYLLLKAALAHSLAAVVSLEQFTEIFLQKEKHSFRWLRDCPVLEVQFGEEYGPQQVHKYLIKHLYEYRGEVRFKTIFVAPPNHPVVLQKYDMADMQWEYLLHCDEELEFDQEL